MKKKYIDKRISIKNKIYKYKITYTYRRRVSMRLNKKNEIIVIGSRVIPKSMLNSFIIKNIVKMHSYVADRKKNYIININKYITLNDKRYNIVYQTSKRNKYIQKEDTFYIETTNEKNKIKVIKQIYSDHMNLILLSYKDAIKDCFSTLKIKPTPILHKWLIAKWGYCQIRSRKIYISDLLCAFPENIIKYVIVHEIAHLLHPNHSDKFWNVVSIFYPDYKLIRKYMKNKDLSI